NGMYRSADAGKTWTHLGLRDAQQINGIAVDPRDSQRVFVAALGHPYGPNAERGLYRSTDGGTSWQKVLGSGVDQGAVEVRIDPKNPDTVYAALWSSRNGPWNLVQVYERYPEGGLYKSTDGGTTWTQLHGGLPPGVGRIGLTIAPSRPSRLYAIVEKPDGCGVYRSDDAGATWAQQNTEERVCGRTEDFAGITADSQDPDVVYSANTQTYRSVDGAKTWTGIKGAPGGDDYHTIWIAPQDRNVILLASDQGATISVNYGRTWSSWYNQPTAQFYHVIADDRFPYRVYGAQQESGSAGVWSRGNDGAITFREFHPVGTEEYGYVAPDPLHPWLIYGGKAMVFDERTGQTHDISPTFDRKKYRFDRTEPLVFNRVDKRTLYLGSSVIFATRDGGQNWKIISPDLTRPNPGEPAALRGFASDDPIYGKHRGVVYSIAPSYSDKSLIWAGTDDGLVWKTRDGGTSWKNVTPKALQPWNRVAQIDPSHFDTRTAYVAVSNIRLDDMRPYVYVTHDGGTTWTNMNAGLPAEPVNAVREDPKRRGLLYAATERSVYVSFDDAAHWQSLQLNLPPTSVRDIVVHGDDLLAGTHGRSFWILDNLTPLRQLSPNVREAGAHLFAPAVTYRVRRDTYSDTPLPPEEPAAQNPPDGAVIDYTIGSAAPVTIGIYDSHGTLVRRFSSQVKPVPPAPDITVPTYWLRPTPIPSASAGMHRFVWDLHYTAPGAVSHDYPIGAVVHDTPRNPQGVVALPGIYTVRLETAGRPYSQTLQVRMDPRVRMSTSELERQFAFAARAVRAMNRTYELAQTAKNSGEAKTYGFYAGLNGRLAQLLEAIDGADMPVTAPQSAALATLEWQIASRP
ncbi:MAG: glycoside hydrolase, partial [Candidatus Eremiobacteraeota bacterium]|nr:glycoside hydrolase [Candidatus Eremiobacteraeota bacterium]